MIGLTIEVKADPALARKIAALNASVYNLDTVVRRVVADSALRIIANAKDLVPLSTGALRRSITATFFDNGWSAIMGSFLPYAARQEYDASLNHGVRPPRRRVINTRAGRVGTIIKGTAQSNPDATWGFMRKSLYNEKDRFLANLRDIVRGIGDAWAT